MNQETLQEFLLDQIRDIYDAEKQLTKALPKMAKAASSEELGEAIRHHLEETENQVTRIEEVFRSLGAPAKSKKCAGMKGLIEEGAEQLTEKDGELRDLAIIAAAQRVEHYEIAAYGTAKALAEQLGNEEVERLLGETQEEEEAADAKLSEIAMSLYEATEEASEDSEGDDESAVAKGPSRQGTAPVRRTRDASGH